MEVNVMAALLGIYLATRVLKEPRRLREAVLSTLLAYAVWKNTHHPYAGPDALATYYFTAAIVWSCCGYSWLEALILAPRRNRALRELADAVGKAPRLMVENQVLEVHRRLLRNRVQQLEAELKARSQGPVAGLDPRTWKLLAQLSHPDRHPEERQGAAHEATTWLNTHRPK